MPNDKLNEKATLDVLNEILELELAGVVRYLHYSLMVFGHARIPIVAWMRKQSDEALAHAAAAGEHVTTLGGHPSLKIGKLLETQRHNIDEILQEALEHEQEGVARYRKLLELAQGRSVMLEEYARRMVHDEEFHVAELKKMLRPPGALDARR
jgi:bacterioferritin